MELKTQKRIMAFGMAGLLLKIAYLIAVGGI